MDFLIFQSPYLMIQALIDGIILGSIFALIAYGMALVWGVMNIINITQGELVILGGYVAFGLYKIGIHPLYGLIASPAMPLLCFAFRIVLLSISTSLAFASLFFELHKMVACLISGLVSVC